MHLSSSKLEVPEPHHAPPTDELFSLQPLPARCLRKVHSCPALVHPETGVIFGLRVGTYLCLLRLPERDRGKALAEAAAWPRSPLASLRDCDVAARFGDDWVVPNEASPAIGKYYLAACGAAARA